MVLLNRAIKLLLYLHENKGREIDSYDEYLQSYLNIGQRQLARELEVLSQNFNNIVSFKKGKKTIYKLIQPIDIINETFKNSFELGFVFEMAKEITPELLEEWNKISKEENKPYIFYNMPYEDIKELEKSKIFQDLLNAIKYQKVIDIIADIEEFIQTKPIKILFSEGNWYIAHIYKDELKITRIQFIKNIKFISKYQINNLQKYINWLHNEYQNPFSLQAKPKKVAKLKASPNINRYFKKGMKKFFKSQKFIEQENDGSIIFSITYTQELEILPFVQKWLPDIAILEPLELKEAFKAKLKKALEYLNV
jgi:predicted DNA-binding transcriptional regulator YafY